MSNRMKIVEILLSDTFDGYNLVVEDHADLLRRIDVLDKILTCTSRVLNPAAHGGDPPIYEKEVEEALELVKQLESIVTTSQGNLASCEK